MWSAKQQSHMSSDFSFNLSHVLSEILKNYDDRTWWRNRFNQRINRPVQQKVSPPSSATNVLQEDWDTLIVLDGCRADLFNAAATTQPLTSRKEQWTEVTSNASATPEWLHRTFVDSHGDIVYIAGNPMVTRHRPDSFHKLIESWKEAYDSETSIISPEKVTRDAITAYSNFPNKRLIVHYMQPHYPFIGYPELNYADYGFEDVGLDGKNENKTIHSVWDAMEADLVRKQEAWDGYLSNLETVLEEVKKLTSEITDRIIITSDHGNMLGERNWPVPVRTYGHPANMRSTGLVKVPWVVIKGERREIIAEDTSVSSSATDQKVRDRLSDLGYIE
jgi:hypothetical protein